MGELQERIYNDIQDQSIDPQCRGFLKMVKADIQRERYKDVPDNIVIKIIKKYIGSAEEMLVYLNKDCDIDRAMYEDEEKMVKFLSGYVPKMASAEEIKKWIEENVDFSQYKNKMQAMKPIMAHFGVSADGNVVKDIIMNM
jgi:uncharacterized protein YqeY